MVDELEELRKANPISVDEAGDLVALDRSSLEEAAAEARWQSRVGLVSAPQTESGRPSAAVVFGVLAAACIVAVLALALTVRPDTGGVIEASVAAPGPADGEPILIESGGRGFDRDSDLLVVHLDFADRGDGHAAVAALEVAAWFNLTPVVVAGTQTIGSNRDVHEYVSVMDAVWGQRWLDAGIDRSHALATSLDRWLETLDSGGQVWVADGGVSDFSADVVGRISEERPDLDTSAVITVVRFGAGDDLTSIETNTNYRRADERNLSGSSDDFEASVLSGIHSGEWVAAFDYLPADELRFPDSTLMLEILRVGTDQVTSVDDWAAFFIGDQPDAQLRGDG